MGTEVEFTDSPSEFLRGLGDKLAQRDGIDIDLLKIIKDHILTGTPAQNAVSAAKDAIRKLAEERAVSPEMEQTSG